MLFCYLYADSQQSSDNAYWHNYGRPGQYIIFLPCGFFLSSSSSIYLSFPRLISATTDWLFTTWRGPSANSEWSEMCCSQLAANRGRKKVAKKIAI